MISYDFDYYMPDTWQEAVDLFCAIKAEGKNPYYFGGGTEIISMARVNSIKPDAVIDIKKIPECLCLGTDGSQLTFGAALTLTTIRESGLYPLLSLAAGRIADHTIQCKLTLGGNLAGTIHYHETLLPLLLADAVIHIAGPHGVRETPICDVLNMGKKLNPVDLILKVSLNNRYTSYPYAHIKKTKAEKIGYPLVSVAAFNMDGTLKLAASALCSFPFRFKDIPITDMQPPMEIIHNLEIGLPEPILNDLEGSAAYRQFIFEKTTEKIIMEFRQSEDKGHA